MNHDALIKRGMRGRDMNHGALYKGELGEGK